MHLDDHLFENSSDTSVTSEPIFCWPVRVYIEDTDAGGIVYYVNYLKFMERARTEFMRSLNFEQNLNLSSTQQFVAHSLNMKFVKPARMDMELCVTVKLLKLSKISFLVQQKVYDVAVMDQGAENTLNLEDKAKLYCESDIKIACVDNEQLKPVRMPIAMYKNLEVFLPVQ